jgi:DNA adenine methylase
MTHGGVRTEKVWMNYPESSSHWPRYAGVNFTDRQRVKRKAQRWAGKYAALPAMERQAVLSAMLAVR